MNALERRLAWKRPAACALGAAWCTWHFWCQGSLPLVAAAALGLIAVRSAWLSLNRLLLVVELRSLRKAVSRRPPLVNEARMELLHSARHPNVPAIMAGHEKMVAHRRWSAARRRLLLLEAGIDLPVRH